MLLVGAVLNHFQGIVLLQFKGVILATLFWGQHIIRRPVLDILLCVAVPHLNV